MNKNRSFDEITEAIIGLAINVHRELPIHKAQLLSYLRLSNRKVGLLINFNVEVLKEGIQRVVNGFQDPQRPLRTLR